MNNISLTAILKGIIGWQAIVDILLIADRVELSRTGHNGGKANPNIRLPSDWWPAFGPLMSPTGFR